MISVYKWVHLEGLSKHICVRLANSWFGHSGTPSPAFPFPPSLLFFLPSLLPFLRGPHPLNQLGGMGEHCKLPQWGVGWSLSQQTIWCISEPKGAAVVATGLCIFVRINLNLCTNTRLLSSRYSVSLRAKHSVGSRGKAPGQGPSGG